MVPTPRTPCSGWLLRQRGVARLILEGLDGTGAPVQGKPHPKVVGIAVRRKLNLLHQRALASDILPTMKNSCWTIFDHKFWQFLVLTISFWGYLILTHSHWRPFGSVCNWGITPQIGHSTGKVIIIHWKVIYTNMFHFHPFSNPLESDIL